MNRSLAGPWGAGVAWIGRRGPETALPPFCLRRMHQHESDAL
jgi:hypothetical protein